MGYKLYILQKSVPMNRLLAAGTLVIQNQVSVCGGGAQSLSPLLLWPCPLWRALLL